MLQKPAILFSHPRRRARGHAQARTPRVVIAVAAACLLAACGQRGPLHLPQEPAAQQRASLPASVFGTGKAAAPAAAAAAASMPEPAASTPERTLP